MIQAAGVVCPACSNVLAVPSMAMQMENQIRAHIAKYYLGYTVCDDEDCGARTRMMGVYGRRCLGLVKEGCKGTVRLEVGPAPSAYSGWQLVEAYLISLMSSTPTQSSTPSCCITSSYSIRKRR